MGCVQGWAQGAGSPVSRPSQIGLPWTGLIWTGLIWTGLLWIGLVAGVGPASAKDIPEKTPGTGKPGTLYQWTSKGGITCHYRLPKDYDAKTGANCTYLLHGSNLTHGWGFANHAAKTFRPDDIVVSPDGTTSNGEGGFNSLGRKEDAKRFHAFHEELKALLKIRSTFLYGHSQGSFFAFYYAGEYPKDVQGVVGHASGVWTQTRLGKKGHHQPIVLMHGTQDPVVPYVQSGGGFSSFQKAGYPMVRLRSLEWWNHWPAEHNGPVPHTSQQLAWVEGMATDDPERMRACWEILGDVKNTDEHDYAGAYLLARHLADSEAAPAAVKKEAAAAVAAIEALVQAHVDEMALATDLGFDDPERILHFVFFMRRFDGIPACDDYVATFEKVLQKHQKKAVASLKKYWPAMRSGDTGEAFGHGVKAVSEGYLWPECHDNQFRENLKKWRKQAKKQKVSKKTLKAYDTIFVAFDKAFTSGWKSFCKVNARKGKL